MHLKEGATVITSKGEKIGRIRHIVLDASTQDVTYIVVEKGILFTQDRMIPMDYVVETRDEEVVLRPGIDSLDDLPHYQSKHYIPSQEDPAYINYAANFGFPVYANPPLQHPDQMNASKATYDIAEDLGLGAGTPADSTPQTIIANDMGVFDRDRNKIGTVTQVFTKADSNYITHFVVAQGVLFKTNKLVPRAWVRDVIDGNIYLSVTENTLKQLTDYEEMDL